MRILVTGGAGYLGYSLTNYLEKSEKITEITVFDNLSKNHPNFFLGTNKLSKTTFVKGDILNNYKLEEILDNIDVVYHLAAHTPLPQNHLDNLRYEQINQWGTLNIVNAIKKRAKVKKLIFLSSSSVYGNRHQIKSSATPQPQNAYSKSKFQAEEYVATLSGRINVNIVRSGNIFGYNPCFRLDAVINRFIFESIVHKKIQIYGDGQQERPFVHLHTLCNYLVKLVDNNSSGKMYITIADFNSNLNQIKDVIEKTVPSLEYTYLNQNLSFDSHSLHEHTLLNKDRDKLITKAFANFNKNIRVK